MAFATNITLDSGVNITYVVVDHVNITLHGYCSIVAKLYTSDTIYTNGGPEVSTVKYVVEGTDFDDYFSESVLAVAGNTVFTQADAYLQTQPLFV